LPYSVRQNGPLGTGMVMSTASDAQHQDFGAIEAAVKETARGRAFLANYARRVQQSDTLTMLAMLGRLERLSDELASRLAELEAGKPSHANQLAASRGGVLPHESVLVPTHHGTADPMQRIDELALVLSNLRRHAVELASHCDDSDPTSSIEIDPRAFTPPDQALLSTRPAGDQELANEELLDKIAQALEPTY
jgi:hypothetical protein